MNKTFRRSAVTANIGENRLLISLYGVLSKKDVETIYTDIRFCVSDLKPGFGVITDLTGCRFGHLSGIPTYKKIMDFLVSQKVGKIVRVVGRAKLILCQLERLSGSKDGYTTHYVTSLAEAEELLSHPAGDRSAA